MAVGGVVGILVVLMVIIVIVFACKRRAKPSKMTSSIHIARDLPLWPDLHVVNLEFSPVLVPSSQYTHNDQAAFGSPSKNSGESKLSIGSEDPFASPGHRQFMNPLFEMDDEEEAYTAQDKAVETAGY